MLSKKMYNKSVEQLINFLIKKREIPLSLAKINEVSTLIKIKRKNNLELADKLVKSKLFDLATEYLKRESKGIRVNINETIYYDFEPIDIILTMKKILDKAHKKNIEL